MEKLIAHSSKKKKKLAKIQTNKIRHICDLEFWRHEPTFHTRLAAYIILPLGKCDRMEEEIQI